jgi:hypothetical protein
VACDRRQDSKHIEKRFVFVQLTTLIRAAGLEGFEIFFDYPSSTIVIDNIEQLARGFDGLVRIEDPLDW